MGFTLCMARKEVCCSLPYVAGQFISLSAFMGTGGFVVVYESPSEVTLSGEEAIPLYCVCSGHCLEYVYQWTVSGSEVGYNSTVLWVKTSGMYRCRVTHHLTHTECLTSLISVVEPHAQGLLVKYKWVIPEAGSYYLSLEHCGYRVVEEQTGDSCIIQGGT